MAVAVYIDGFNLYYGLARPMDCKWVDLQRFFETQFPRDDIGYIGFFEALIAGPTRNNQKAYLGALESKPKVRVILGEMKRKQQRCHVSGCTFAGPREYPYYEEKHTDVSIAITMVDDAHRKAFEKQILVAADTDLVPALRMIKQIRPQQQVVLCIPAMDKKRILAAKPMAVLADSYTRADAELFLKCQFPATFTDEMGKTHVRPAAWRDAPLTAARDWRGGHPDRWLSNLPSW